MENELLFDKLKRMYEESIKDIKALREKCKELKQSNRSLKNKNRELEKKLIKQSIKQPKKELPSFKFVERRSGQRRKKDIPVSEDRRTGLDRRKYNDELIHPWPEYKIIFDDFFPRDNAVYPLILKSDETRIIHAYWELWHIILGYDLKKIEDIREIYIDPETRDEILQEVKQTGYYKRGIEVARAGGGYVSLNSVFVKDPKDNGEYYVFIIVDQYQEGK